jgi:hypothetical protein
MNEKKCREIVLERSQGLCERCGRRAYLTIHHRKKRSHRGEWSLTNCVAVGGSGTTGCHGWIESHPNDAHAIGFHCRPWESAEEIPILLYGKSWVKLDSRNPQYNSVDEGDE